MSQQTDQRARELERLGKQISASLAEEARLRRKAADESTRANRSKNEATVKSHQRRSADYMKRAEKELAKRSKLEARRTKVQQELDGLRARAERMLNDEHRRQQQQLNDELARMAEAVRRMTPQPQLPPDVFICHAGEDKPAVARPLADALLAEGVPRVWYDEYSLTVGDSLRRSIDKGLAECRFGAVILSRSFFAKEWSQYELDGLVERMNQEGRNLILPIWHDITKEEVIKHSPPLAGRFALLTASLTIPQIAERLADVIMGRTPPLGG